MLPKVSVIIPAFNAEKYIAETLESVLSQDYPNVETIVVDDGSTDRTPEVIVNIDRGVMLLKQQKLGVSAARNKGVNFAKGIFILFLDADDLLEPGCIRKQAQFLNNQESFGAVFSNARYFSEDESGKRNIWDFPVKPKRIASLGSPEKNQWIYLNENPTPMGTVMARSKQIDEQGGFDTNLSGVEDWDYWFRFGGRYKMAYLPIPALLYRFHSQGLSRNEEHMRSEIKKLMAKFQSTSYFITLPNWKKSIYYLKNGGNFLLLDDANWAIENFSLSIKAFPVNPWAWFAFIGTVLMKRRAKKVLHRLRKYIP